MQPHLLFIEDHPDIREALTEFLHQEGYRVTARATAEEGLAALAAGRFDALITDFALPDHTGSWMLEEAERRGVLHKTPGLLITATPQHVQQVGPRVLAKPVDLDELLEALEAMVGPSGRAAGRAPTAELTLYVVPGSTHCGRALRNLRAHLEGYVPGDVRLTICDVSQDPDGAAAQDRVWVTPTLVVRSVAPKTWVMGDLTDRGPLERLLSAAGVRRKGDAT